MYETTLEIRFISDWHIGSGLGDGAIADAVLVRDNHGIPCIPGSALKGALREGAWRLGLCDPEYAKLPDLIFGTASEERVTNRPGLLTAGQGRLDQGLRQWLEARGDFQEFLEDMTVIRQQTRLDAQKQVAPHSLRSIECGIPGLAFTAAISAAVPDEAKDWFGQYLAAICACVKSIGGYRSRGIGRCILAPKEKLRPGLPGAAPASLLALQKEGR